MRGIVTTSVSRRREQPLGGPGSERTAAPEHAAERRQRVAEVPAGGYPSVATSSQPPGCSARRTARIAASATGGGGTAAPATRDRGLVVGELLGALAAHLDAIRQPRRLDLRQRQPARHGRRLESDHAQVLGAPASSSPISPTPAPTSRNAAPRRRQPLGQTREDSGRRTAPAVSTRPARHHALRLQDLRRSSCCQPAWAAHPRPARASSLGLEQGVAHVPARRSRRPARRRKLAVPPPSRSRGTARAASSTYEQARRQLLGEPGARRDRGALGGLSERRARGRCRARRPSAPSAQADSDSSRDDVASGVSLIAGEPSLRAAPARPRRRAGRRSWCRGPRDRPGSCWRARARRRRAQRRDALARSRR